MLYPYEAVISESSSEYFVNWRHANSSMSYSVGVLAAATAQNVHDYTEGTHNSQTELYSLRRRDIAITSATQRDGSILYTRSNFIDGAWRTIMLSADRHDVPILNAVAASIDVGYASPILFTENGRLENVIRQTAALVAEGDKANQPSSDATSAPQPSATQASSGTGFVVSGDGYILTNAHVVDGCTTLKFAGLFAEVVAESPEFDLALIHAPDWTGTGIATFSPTPAKLNSDVTVVGYPLAGILSGLNVTRGSVSSQMGYGGLAGGMQITAPVQPGNSGGPVLAADGEVVGVVVSKLNAQVVADATGDIPQNVNFAIRGELAKLFLFQHGIDPSLGTSDEPVSPVDLADAASDFTGFIECN
jgi:S1-C subfamily serine protease